MAHPFLSDGEVEARGVYVARHLSRHGFPELYAVDSRHREVDRVEVRDASTFEAIERHLSDALDARDPLPSRRPRLRLVRDDEGATRANRSPAVTLALCGAIRRHSPRRA